jgi:methenyltetrahydromethanopterin cyclohydrolase
VKGPAAAEELAEKLPSGTSRDYGRPFAEIFKAYKGDFYKIDGSLFACRSAGDNGRDRRNLPRRRDQSGALINRLA